MRTLALSVALLLFTQVAWSQEKSRPPGEMLKAALELHRKGDLEGAIREYEALLARSPDAADIRANLGAAYAAAARYDEAIAQLEQALKLGNAGDPVAINFNLGWACFKAGHFDKAVEALSRVVAVLPGDKDATLLLASCYHQSNEDIKIIELLAPLEPDLGGNPEFAYLLGIALIHDGQVDKGERLAGVVLRRGEEAQAHVMLGAARVKAGDFFRAADEFKRALELDPKLPFVNAAYGGVLRELDRQDEADEAYRRELEINPADFDSNFQHGIHLYKFQQKYEEALAHLNRALRLRPGSGEVRFQIGLVYSMTDRNAEALEIVREVAKDTPNSLEVHTTLARLCYQLGQREDAERHRAIADRLRKDQAGQLLIQQGRLSEAVELFRQLKAADPSGRANFFAGMALSLMKDWPAAAVELKEAVRLDPGNPKYIITYADALVRQGKAGPALELLGPVKPEWVSRLPPEAGLSLSETYYRAGNFDASLQVLDVMARRDPYSARINLLRGQIYLVKGNYQPARQYAEKSVGRLPQNNPQAYSILGMARYQLGDRAGAKEAFLEALKQDPGNPEYLYKLGAACLAQGESGEAIRYLEQARPAAEKYPAIYAALAQAYQALQDPLKSQAALEQYQAITNKLKEAAGKPPQK